MLRSDFSRKAHANFQNIFFCTQYVFSSPLTANRRQFHVKLKSILKIKSYFSVSIDVFNHFIATNIKNKITLGV